MQLQQTIINELIQCYKSHNYRYDFSTEEIFVDDNSAGIYIHITPLHKQEYINYIENTHFFYKELPMEEEKFNEHYIEFMKNYCSQKRNLRYAVQMEVIYPKKIISLEQKKRFIKEFVMHLCGLNKPLPFFVENKQKGNGSYAVITVIDRLYLGEKTWKIYKKDVWIDSRTGKFPSRDCPKEFRILKRRAGDYCLDKNGERIPSKAVFSNSLRTFSYGKEMETGRNKWEEFISMIKQKFIDTVLKVCGKVDAVKKGKRLHKTECKPEYHRYVRRRIAAINFAKQTIEYTTNFLLNKACKGDIVYEPYNGAKNRIIKHSENYKRIIKIFMKYKTRFNKKCFHDQHGIERKVDYYKQNVYELDKNIEILLDSFFQEIEALQM